MNVANGTKEENAQSPKCNYPEMEVRVIRASPFAIVTQ